MNKNKIFEKEFKSWVDLYGLNQWLIQIGGDPWESDSICELITNCYMKSAKVEYNEHEILPPQLVAFHEATELLLEPLKQLAKKTYSDELVDTTAHEIINSLTKIMVKAKLLKE